MNIKIKKKRFYEIINYNMLHTTYNIKREIMKCSKIFIKTYKVFPNILLNLPI